METLPHDEFNGKQASSTLKQSNRMIDFPPSLVQILLNKYGFLYPASERKQIKLQQQQT
jgi:hypothetical protein